MAFGDDVEAIWRLLHSLDGWRVVNVAEALARPLGTLMERDLGRRVRYYGDVYHTLSEPPTEHAHPLVRRLTPVDTPLLEAAPSAIQGAGFGGPAGLLREGIVAGAVDGNRLVGIAHTSAITERYADVGVATLEPYRGQGISTAAASLVCRAIQETGRTPVWSCGEDNRASLRVAEKVGFRQIGRRLYVIPAQEKSGP
jgi:RimJ/RimL family protein N-acetyltransferase